MEQASVVGQLEATHKRRGVLFRLLARARRGRCVLNLLNHKDHLCFFAVLKVVVPTGERGRGGRGSGYGD